ncbi:hypothetical protein D083_1175 [Dickeya solani RNS 08.23.3.1.A]|nr:hypothetical protein D083_1175 [Dickeya solani RNS 08.23.3.1.A]
MCHFHSCLLTVNKMSRFVIAALCFYENTLLMKANVMPFTACGYLPFPVITQRFFQYRKRRNVTLRIAPIIGYLYGS